MLRIQARHFANAIFHIGLVSSKEATQDVLGRSVFGGPEESCQVIHDVSIAIGIDHGHDVAGIASLGLLSKLSHKHGQCCCYGI